MAIYNVQVEDSAGNQYCPKPDLLTTKEQLSANTAAGKSVDALVVKELNNKLAVQPNWIIDQTTGKITGYKTLGGADTVFPFRGENNIGAAFLFRPYVSEYNKLYLLDVKFCSGFDVDDEQTITCRETGEYKINIIFLSWNVNYKHTWHCIINKNNHTLDTLTWSTTLKGEEYMINLNSGDTVSMGFTLLTKASDDKVYAIVILTKVQ